MTADKHPGPGSRRRDLIVALTVAVAVTTFCCGLIWVWKSTRTGADVSPGDRAVDAPPPAACSLETNITTDRFTSADEDGYLDVLRRCSHLGLRDGPEMIPIGYSACTTMDETGSLPAARRAVARTNGFTARQANLLVFAAGSKLCPQVYSTVRR